MLRPVSPGFASSRQASHLPPSLISVCPGSSVPSHRHPRRPRPQTIPFPSRPIDPTDETTRNPTVFRPAPLATSTNRSTATRPINAADETTRNPAIFRLAPSTTSMIPSAPSQPVARLDEPTRNPTTFRPAPSTSPTKPPAPPDPLHQPARRANPQARPASPHPRFHPPHPVPYNSKKRRPRICATAAMPLIADRRRGGPAPPDPPRAP